MKVVVSVYIILEVFSVRALAPLCMNYLRTLRLLS